MLFLQVKINQTEVVCFNHHLPFKSSRRCPSLLFIYILEQEDHQNKEVALKVNLKSKLLKQAFKKFSLQVLSIDKVHFDEQHQQVPVQALMLSQ